MTNKEKLSELLIYAKDLCSIDRQAEFLLANGVTFAKDTDVPSKWISVDDRLPEPGVLVLVYSKLGCTYFSHRLYRHLEGKAFSIEYSGGWEVTHWMPLPLPPTD